MGIRVFYRPLSWAAILAVSFACDSEEKKQLTAPSAAPPASATATAKETEPAPGKCQASKDKPTQLRSVVGDVYGFVGDATHLYYSVWDVYGQNGKVGRIRKDGKGAETLVSLKYAPRGLALDEASVYYTEGILLNKFAKSDVAKFETPDPQFSSQAIALYGDDIYGVPGDYGPYDRVARIAKKGGKDSKTKELVRTKRVATELTPNGFSSIVVDETGIYVTDSGKNRVIRYALTGGPPKPLAVGKDKPYSLAIVGANVYFNLARKGDLMAVSKEGGKVTTLTSGLAEMARLAADPQAIYTTLAGKTDEDPQTIAKIGLAGGEVEPVAVVSEGQTVSAIALDTDCVYWAQRESASKSMVFALAR